MIDPHADTSLPTQADFSNLNTANSIAVGLSGGADSLALTHMLCHLPHHPHIHAMIIDHNLRDGSAAEAAETAARVAEFPDVTVTTMVWDTPKPKTGIMQAARQARYQMMQDYCAMHDIHHLAIGHHSDDQMETFLIRLSKGSGLDGLSCMTACSPLSETLSLHRPLLHCTHQDLVAYCQRHALTWIEDPGNHNTAFERNRLRQSADILAAEGLSSTRIATLSHRLARARRALESISNQAFTHCLIEEDQQSITLDWPGLSQQPEEIILRVIITAMQQVTPTPESHLRLEKIENLLQTLLTDNHLKRRSLYHCLISCDASRLIICKEG